MKTGTKVFLGIVGALTIYFGSDFKKKEPEKAIAPLDYSKPIYTSGHSVICPMSLLSDPRRPRYERGDGYVCVTVYHGQQSREARLRSLAWGY